MKKFVSAGVVAISALLSAHASLYSVGDVNGSGASLNMAIPDGNPSGIASSLAVSGLGSSLSDITVTLNLSGGRNGDLYGYLSFNGTLITLLNRVGTGSGGPIQQAFGFSTAGLNNISLNDAGTGGNIHDVASPVSGITYMADGGSLATYNGMNPNGTWTLFFADMAGGNTSTLNGWSLDITAVPEPVNVAMAVFGASFVGIILLRAYRGSKKSAS